VPALNAATLLTVWEQGVLQHPVERSLELLAISWPELTAQDWANVSVGRRDRQLLLLREELFGSKLEAVAICPQCGTRLELVLSTRDLQTPAAQIFEAPQCLESGSYEVEYRLPTSADLLEVANNLNQAREILLERCVEARSEGEAVQAAALPQPVLKLLGEKMAQADPQAEVRIAVDCPDCLHHWSSVFDVLSYLWGEIEDWAERLLRDVHSLASAYGWSERDIISMTALRRRLYLEMLGA